MTEFELSPGQQDVLRCLLDTCGYPTYPETLLTGAAGTGKTWMASLFLSLRAGGASPETVKHVIKQMSPMMDKILHDEDIDDETGEEYLENAVAPVEGPLSVRVMAPTGKAAKVISEKMLKAGVDAPPATTIHRSIYAYDPAMLQAAEVMRQRWGQLKGDRAPKAELDAVWAEVKSLEASAKSLKFDLREEGVNLLVVDEASMVGKELADDIRKLGIPILALGDPYQLPPVDDEPGFDLDSGFELTEQHRNAGQVLEWATRVREGKGLAQFHRRFNRDVLSPDSEGAGWQVICGTNAVRSALNARARQMRGHCPDLLEPNVGEKVICVANDLEYEMANGEIFQVLGFSEVSRKGLRGARWYPAIRLLDEATGEEKTCRYTMKPAGGEGPYPRPGIVGLDFAYVLTAHKSQGSEYRNVCVVDESGSFRHDKYRWLYTAVSRAQERVVICDKKSTLSSLGG